MLKKIWLKLNNTTIGGAIIIAFFSVLSKIVGLLRERLLAVHFAGNQIDILDSYYAAFKLPDIVFNTLVLGALSSAFVPVFVRYLHRNKTEAFRIANSLLNTLLVIIFILTIIGIITADKIVPLLVPGFDSAKTILTVRLTRIMFVAVIFFTISNVLSGLLNSFRKFFTFSLAPIFYNLGIIIGIIFLTDWFGVDGLAWGVVLGSILHLLIQLPEVIATGWKWQPLFAWRDKGVRKIFKLMLPRTFGLAVNQVNQLVIVIIASTLASGSIAYFNLANNLQSFPISVFGVSIALACFPVFSRALADKNTSQFQESFSVNFRRILYLIVPASVLLLLLRAQIVRLILGSGSFTWRDTIQTAQTLGFFALSLFAQSLLPLITRSFYALEDTKTPVLVSLGSVIINIFLAITLGQKIGIFGVALAYSIASIINMVVLLIILRLRVGYLDDEKLAGAAIRIGLLSIFMGLTAYLIMRIVAPLVNMRTFIGILIQTTTTIIISGGLYLWLSFLFNFPEVQIIKNYLAKYIKIFK